ncbi:hypothetical protein GGI17_005671 [Coemansia sp. S146]|nr:hypothetical protein GGI17_005671 [Coemansia sp. S146]
MENGDTRGWAKGPSASGPQQPGLPQRGAPSSGLTAPGSAPVSAAQHRFPAPGSANQLPPIQSTMSPKADGSSSGSGSRAYIPPISHSSPNSAGLAAQSHAAARTGSYPSSASTPLTSHAQATFGSSGMSPIPAPGSAPAGAGPPSSTQNTLPSITSPYVRSPTFTSTSVAAIPPIKVPQQQQQQSQSQHVIRQQVSSPVHGPSSMAVVHDMSGAPVAPYSSAHAPASRVLPPPSITSPGARAGPPPMQSPPMHPQHPTSAPPPRQMQSPRLQRTASSQSTPVLQMPQPASRPLSNHMTAPNAPSTMSAASPPFATASRAPTAIAAPSTSTPSAHLSANSRPSVGTAPLATSTQPVSANGSASVPVAAIETSNDPAKPQVDASGRQLNVSDALSYLDLVKSQFQASPEVYNQFLEIMKEFKSHAIDTPGVIDRVSRLFHGCPSLIQGFNTFLPPGYRIECSDDPREGVRVTTPSGTIMSDVNRRPSAGAPLANAPPMPQSPPTASNLPAVSRGHSSQPHQQFASRDQYASRRAPSAGAQAHLLQSPTLSAHAAGGAPGAPGLAAPSMGAAGIPQYSQGAGPGSTSAPGQMAARSPSATGSPSLAPAQRSRQVPMEFNHAINYVNKIKMRFAAEPDRYKEFLEILQTYQKESRPIQDVYAQVQVLFAGAPDLLDEFKQFLPDTSESAGSMNSPTTPYARPVGGSTSQGQSVAGQHGMGGVPESMAGARLPPVGNFTPVSTTGHGADPFASTTPTAGAAAASLVAGAAAQAAGAASSSGRKRRAMMSGNVQVPGSASTKRRSKAAKGEGIVDPTGAYGQPGASIAAVQQPINPATATADELAFFERVKRFIGQPSAYNEFLKLLNLYNQQVLDPKTLVDRAESFIGDDLELFGWFKQFVGFDEQQLAMEDARSGDEAIMESILGPEPGVYMTPEEHAKILRPPRAKINLSLCKEYGPSYRLLPDSSAQSRCSGRDAMCYEVLNDRWASHPTWASEETEFVYHKKNLFEEAMFRSEEDRHEMDIEIDTNLSVIRQLTPIAQQIEQMDPDKLMQLTLPENFWGMSEALPRRALRKVYDSSRTMEIIKAMHTHPAVAVPIVLKRLKQKDEEWRRQRREYAKIWRENDAKNYYRALDHQGLTFKAVDRKNISPKQLITEIETRRREQQSLTDEGSARNLNRKVALALRHRYQLEYQFSVPTVIADVINAILAHVGKHNSQFAPPEKELMEKFFHELFGGLLSVENPAPPCAVGSKESASPGASDDEARQSVQQRPTANGSAAPTNGVVSAAKVNGTPGIKENGPLGGTESEAAAPASADADSKLSGEAMDVDGAAGQDTADTNANSTVAASTGAPEVSDTPQGVQSLPTDEGSKPSTPGLISSRSWIQIGPANNWDMATAVTPSGLAAKSMSRAFYTNSNYYLFMRLFQILYERFNRLRELGPECQNKVTQAQQAQSVANKLGLLSPNEVLKDYDLEHTDYYTIFLELVDQFLQGQLETNSFEEAMRVMYGINAYKILTVDKVVQAIAKNIQQLISDTRSVDILDLFTALPPVHEQSPLRSHIAYRMKVEALVGADEHVFRIDYIYESQTMTIQLLRREDITLDEAVTEEERWAYYVDSYVLFEPTEGVPRLQQSRPRPYLSRHLHADECDYDISSRSSLEIKIAVNTYKLCFLTGTEDIYANHTRRVALTDAAAKTAYDERWGARTSKWRQWVEQEQASAAAGQGDGASALTEWWK